MPFTFKQFHIDDQHCGMPVSTDGVILGAWANLQTANYILDIGAGSGLLSLMAAQRTKPTTQITAIECEPTAAIKCQLNFDNSPWPLKLNLIKARIQDFSHAQNQTDIFDHIICNPPYFTSGPQSATSARSVARHTNSLPFTDLLDSVRVLLSQFGEASFILPTDSAIEFVELLPVYGLKIVKRTNVATVEDKVPTRALVAIQHQQHLTPNPLLINTDAFYIRDRHHQYSQEMRDLCQDFYLKL